MYDTYEEMMEFLSEEYPNNCVMDGFDEAIVGHDESDGRIIYDYRLVIDKLVKDGSTVGEAIEYIDFNIIRAFPYFHKTAPILMYGIGCTDFPN